MASPEIRPSPEPRKAQEGSYRHPAPEKSEISSAPTRIYLVRHGESEANLDPLFSGEPSLTEKGHIQAKKLGKMLHEKAVQFAAIITSGRPRAVQTAKDIATQVGEKIPLEAHDGLSEKKQVVRYKETGLRVPSEVEKKLQEEKKQLSDQARWTHKPDEHTFDTNAYESEQEAAMRMRRTIADIALHHPGQTVLAVTHGDVMRSFNANLLENEGNLQQSAFGEQVHNAGYLALEAAVTAEGMNLTVLERNLDWTKDDREVVEHLIADFKQEEAKIAATTQEKIEEAKAKGNAKDKAAAQKEKDKKKKKKPSWASKQMTNIKNYFQRKVDNLRNWWSDFTRRKPPKLKPA